MKTPIWTTPNLTITTYTILGMWKSPPQMNSPPENSPPRSDKTFPRRKVPPGKVSVNSLNAVERKNVPTRVLNPNASEASYKSKQ